MNLIVEAMRSARQQQGLIATVVSIGTLIIGATTVFAALESALQQIWSSRDTRPGGWRGFLRTRVISFGFVLAVGFLLSTALGTALIALLYRYLPAQRLAWRHVLWGALATTLLFQVGRWAIGLYLGRSTEPTSFGAEITAVIGGSRTPERADPRPQISPA